MKRNNTIDFMRLICAVFVVFVHATFPGTVGSVIRQFGRLSVPFFLMVSGYYATPRSAPKQLRSTLRLTGIAAAFYFAVNSVRCLISGRPVLGWLAGAFGRKNLAMFLLLNQLAFVNVVMYYFFMLMYVYIIYCAAARWGVQKYPERMILPLLLAGIALSYLGKRWYYVGNWIFTGMPFFFLGQIISRHPEYRRYAKVCMLLGICFCAAEGWWGDFYLSVGAVVLSVGVFLFCIGHPSLVSASLAERCRRLSLPVFVIHCGALEILRPHFPEQTWLFPLLILLITVVLSAAVVYIADLKKRA